jgi:uncharacterized phiE125 gp8 family phage protein
LGLKLITALATEPITLADVKLHLKLDSTDLATDITTEQSIVPGSKAPGTITGSGVDILGYMALINLDCGTNLATGTVDAKIQDSEDNVTYTDWTGGVFTQVTTANDNALYEKAYTGSKRYIRVVATVANAACEFAASIIKKGFETAEDSLLTRSITVAREYGEEYTRRAFATQTWELVLDDFPSKDFIELPKAPLQSVTSVKYKDYAGTESTMTVTTDYIVDIDSEPGRVVLAYGKTWPSFTAYPSNAVCARYICGYDGTTNIIPKCFIQAMLFHVGLLYKYRDSDIPKECIDSVNRIYYPKRIHTL